MTLLMKVNRRSHSILRLMLTISISCATPSIAQNLDITNVTATPIPGAGHDYLHDLNEVVSPANGSVSIRIAAPTPKERALNFPIYAYTYDTSGQLTVSVSANAPSECNQIGGYQCYTSAYPNWGPSNLQQGPGTIYSHYTDYSYAQGPDNVTITCNYSGGYIFTDLDGGRHSLGIIQIQSEDPTGGCQTFGVENQNAGGDDQYKAEVVGGVVQVMDNHGNMVGSGLANAEDTNGNFRNGTGRTWKVNTAFENGATQLTSMWVPGFPTAYTYAYTSPALSFTPPTALQTSISSSSCDNTPATVTYSYNFGYGMSALKTLTLPSLQTYGFEYNDPYGLVSKITYPTGAVVTYTWALPSDPTDLASYTGNATIGAPLVSGNNPNCYYRYTMPEAQSRIVKFDGVTPAFEQDFVYVTNWPNSGFYWTSKQTTVTTKDLVRTGNPSYTTIYNYLPMFVPSQDPSNPSLPTAMPVEDTIIYNDYSGNTLKTTKKIWNYPNQLAAECEILPNGQVSGKFYTYEPYSWGSLYASGYESYTTDQITDVAEYDYGQVTSACTPPSITPARETKTVFQSFGNTPYWPVGQYMSDRPATVQEYAGGVLLAETDYVYDHTSVSAVSPGPAYGHDQNSYAANAVTQLPRGNTTSVTKKCFVGKVGCLDTSTTLAYDETGQVIAVTDAKGNKTTLSYTDEYTDGTPPRSANSNTYLTTLTRPTTNSVLHQQTFQYDYIKGELVSAKDENKNVSTYQYNDPWNRLTFSSFPDGGQTSVSYNDSNLLTPPYKPTVTTSTLLSSGINLVHESIYDPIGHLTDSETADTAGTIITHVVSDGLGRTMTTTTPYRSSSDLTYGVTTFTYDALGRKTVELNPGSTSKKWCYDNVSGNSACSPLLGDVGTGTWVDYLDEVTNHWQRASNSFGNLTQVMEPNGSTQAPTMETRYYYDGLNNLLQVNQWGGPSGGSNTPRTRTFSFNSLSQLLSVTNLESGTILYTYDLNGNLSTKVDARNITSTYSYDALNRLLSKTYLNDPSGTQTACYQYDSSSSQSTTQNWIGRLTNQWTQSASTGVCGTTFPSSGVLTRRSVLAYDRMGRIKNEQQCTPSNCSTSTQYNPTYTYDFAGNRLTMSNGITTTPTVNTLTFTNVYDSVSRLQSLTSNWNDATHPAALFTAQALTGQCNPSTATPAYAPFGALTSAMLGSGLALNRTFDTRLRASCEMDKGSVLSTATNGSATVTIVGSEQSK